MAAQILTHFTPSEEITSSLLQHFNPLGSPTLTPFYPLWTNYPPHSYNILPPPPWQPNSYIIKPPLNKEPPHSYNILYPLAAQLLHPLPPLEKLPPYSYTILTTPPPLAAQILAHVTPSGKINPSLLQHFTTLGSPTLASFYPL